VNALLHAGAPKADPEGGFVDWEVRLRQEIKMELTVAAISL
jgi:hypothetical protein